MSNCTLTPFRFCPLLLFCFFVLAHCPLLLLFLLFLLCSASPKRIRRPLTLSFERIYYRINSRVEAPPPYSLSNNRQRGFLSGK
jgi:hypothetical protein